jgi:hypothetical protein
MPVQGSSVSAQRRAAAPIVIGVIIALIVVAAVLMLQLNPKELPTGDGTAPAPVASTDAKPASPAPAAAAPKEEMAELPLELPNPVFSGTPKDIPAGARMLPPTGKSRDPFLAPKGAVNLSLNKPVTGSDKNPTIGKLDLITDGDKEALDGRYVELAPGVQWVQVDLGAESELFAVVVWHLHQEPEIYRDVIVQLSSDPDMLKGVQVLFNNDYDNSAGLGKGEDYEFFEDFEGKLIDAKGAKGRYLRFYSNGSTSNDINRYTEIEVWGRPAK